MRGGHRPPLQFDEKRGIVSLSREERVQVQHNFRQDGAGEFAAGAVDRMFGELVA